MQSDFRFSMVYAYFAVMGGFVAETGHLHFSLTRVTLSSNAILFLAKQGHILRISEASIQDKSKADFLAKGLVCFQVWWVAGQTIERKVAGYPITLLEIHNWYTWFVP